MRFDLFRAVRNPDDGTIVRGTGGRLCGARGVARTARRIAVLPAALALLGGFVTAAQADLPFRDDFDALNKKRWFVSNGWANGDHQSCLWVGDRASVQDGVLRLTLTDDPAEDRDLSCAEVQSVARFGPGIYEARMKVPFAPGTNANFFSFIGASENKPHHEIDFEFIGRRPGALQTNYWVDGKGGNEEIVDVPDADAQFHTYSFIWERDRLRWFIDGRLVREVDSTPVPTKSQKIFFSLWSTETLSDWLGKFAYPGEPLTMEVDWVSYTPLSTPCLFEGSIACSM